jgi:hypothetical protein
MKRVSKIKNKIRISSKMKRASKMKRVRKMKRVSKTHGNWQPRTRSRTTKGGLPGIPLHPSSSGELLVNQEGSLDLQPSGSSSPHVEVGQEDQTMERNDLQLIPVEEGAPSLTLPAIEKVGVLSLTLPTVEGGGRSLTLLPFEEGGWTEL